MEIKQIGCFELVQDVLGRAPFGSPWQTPPLCFPRLSSGVTGAPPPAGVGFQSTTWRVLGQLRSYTGCQASFDGCLFPGPSAEAGGDHVSMTTTGQWFPLVLCGHGPVPCPSATPHPDPYAMFSPHLTRRWVCPHPRSAPDPPCTLPCPPLSLRNPTAWRCII